VSAPATDGSGAARFVHVNPTRDAFWRAIVLFGQNSASYKFALSKAILALAPAGRTELSLAALAGPFASAVCDHLRLAERQGTNPRSRYLDACRRHLAGGLSHEGLVEATVALGFKNVIDAFHSPRGVRRPELGDALVEAQVDATEVLRAG
jgi:hypothetical protein